MKDGHLNLSLHVPFLFYFVILNWFSPCEKFLSSPQHPDNFGTNPASWLDGFM